MKKIAWLIFLSLSLVGTVIAEDSLDPDKKIMEPAFEVNVKPGMVFYGNANSFYIAGGIRMSLFFIPNDVLKNVVLGVGVEYNNTSTSSAALDSKTLDFETGYLIRVPLGNWSVRILPLVNVGVASCDWSDSTAVGYDGCALSVEPHLNIELTTPLVKNLCMGVDFGYRAQLAEGQCWSSIQPCIVVGYLF
jgi:hypothetical protein